MQGCGELTNGRYCDHHRQHAEAAARDKDRARGTAAQRGYGSKWQRERLAYLRQHPICAIRHHCRGAPATVVEHIVPHRGDMKLMWSRSNWQPACKRCADWKTATQDSRFARREG